MIWHVTVGGRTHAVEVDGATVRVDGRVVEAHLRPVEGGASALLEVGGRRLRIGLEREGAGRWAVTALGDRWAVEVESERARAIRLLAGAAAGSARAQPLKAPMPGLVVRVLVEPGQAVAAGQGLVVLEAMKMENELRATGAGTVARVAVGVGAAVQKGAVLVEFEG